jgi:ABC-type branched-subunit amino acid transport system substrate-binding protein
MLRMLWLRRLALIAVLAMFATACGDAEEAETNGEDVAVDDTEDTEDTETEDDGDGQLKFGYVLPETGPLAFLGPPQIEALNFAVSRINEAGGVLDNDVTVLSGDEAGDASVASQSADRLLSQNVDAIIGAAASGMSLAIIDKVTGAEVVQCSGSNTAPTFTDYDDDGFYFRTAPTDALQGPVLAETIVGEGHQTVAIVARADDYGRGLADATAAALEEQGAEVVETVIYDPEATTFSAEVEKVAAANPDAVALIAFDEGAQILQSMIEAGVGPQDVGVFGADGVRSNDLAAKVDPNNPGILEGMMGTAPDPSADPDFLEELQAFAPALEETTFAGQVYDCTNIIALAAIAAGTDDASAFKDEVVEVTRGGTECDSFEACKALLEDGEDIDYQGASGPLEFTEAGEPSEGLYEVWQIGADGKVESLEVVTSSLE